MYFDDDIAVVGAGCFFPGASDVEAFWKLVSEGRPVLRPVPDERWPASLYVGRPGEEDKTYSCLGAFTDDRELDRVAARFSLDRKRANRLQLFVLEAARQALQGLPTGLRSLIALGCLGPDDEFSYYKFLLEEASLREYVAALPDAERPGAEKILEETLGRIRAGLSDPLGLVLTTSALNRVAEVLGFRGEGCLVDAACASSLAALDVAMKKLRSRECDLALAGGVESELPPEQFVLFSRLGLMAKESPYPLDDRSDGITQGEGAALFALMRLADARQRRFPIWAVLTGCGGSSNGKGSSLFSPTSQGQRLALERAYGDRRPETLDYLECHATGTRVGDATEIDTVEAFFAKSPRPLPMGSVKALIGHTKGAAGAAGLLKGLLALRHRTAPPSPYFKSYVEGKSPRHVYVNPEPVPFAEAPVHRVGVSSAGFGGTNYHVAVAEHRAELPVTPRTPPSVGELAVLATAYVPREGSLEFLPEYGFRIPPKNLEGIDDTQLLTLMAVAEAWDRTGLDLLQLPRERISVLSCCCLGLDAWLSQRVRHFEFARDRKEDAAVRALLAHRDAYPKVTEDAGPGTLNNVIAGRVANVFDFQGTNFHVDADLKSFPCALGVARLELWHECSEYVVLVGIEDYIDDSIPDVMKGGVHALILCRPETAAAVGRAPLFFVEKVSFAA